MKRAPGNSAPTRSRIRSLTLPLGFVCAAALTFLGPAASGQSIDLGTASSFVVLAGSGITVAGAVNSTIITGDIGSFPITSMTGLSNVVLNGVNHGGDAVTQRAKIDMLAAYNAAASFAPTRVFAPAANLGGLSLGPGVYRDPTSFGLTGSVTLNAGGNPNAVFVFQAGSTLTTAAMSRVVLAGGAQACHVFWQVGSSAVLGASSSFKGSILALTSITLTTGATVEGRLLALNGAVTLDTNAITIATCAGLGVDGGGNIVPVAPTQETFVGAVSLIPLTPNQETIAGELANAFTDDRQSNVLEYINNSDLGTLPGEFDKISAEELTSIFYLGFAQFDTEVFSLQQRLADVRAGSPDRTESAPLPANDGKSMVYDKRDGKSMPSGKTYVSRQLPTEDRWGFFITESGDFTSLGDTANANGFDLESAGTTLGFDRRLTENLLVGLMLGYTRSNTDLIDGGSLEADAGKVGLYAMYHTGGFFAEGLVGAGYQSYETRRAGLDGTARGDTEGTQFDAYTGIGYDVKLGSFTLTPMASLLYSQVGIDSYDEHGSLQPLHIESQHESSLHSRVGLRAAYTARVGAARVTPSVSAHWQHEFLENELALAASFANGAGRTFAVHGPEVGRDSALLTAAVNIAWSRYACYLAYQADVGRENYESHRVLGGLRVTW